MKSLWPAFTAGLHFYIDKTNFNVIFFVSFEALGVYEMPALLIDDPRITWPKDRKPGWKLSEAGLDGGQFGRIEHRVYGRFDRDGNFVPLFDRPVNVEGPHAIAIAFGRDPGDGKFKLGLVNEVRDTAAPADGETSLSFWGPPRGFAEKGDNGAIGMARRETGQETGANVLAGKPWVIGNFITNETCTASWSPVVAVPVNLARLSEIQGDDGRGEKILKAQFFTEDQVRSMILSGSREGGLTTSMVLGQTLLLYQLHVKKYTTMDPDTLLPSLQEAWYPVAA